MPFTMSHVEVSLNKKCCMVSLKLVGSEHETKWTLSERVERPLIVIENENYRDKDAIWIIYTMILSSFNLPTIPVIELLGSLGPH